MTQYKEVQCNKCKRKHTTKGMDVCEYQEFLRIDTVGGYGSVWGDGTKIQLDLCQSCQYEMFKDYVVEVKTLG